MKNCNVNIIQGKRWKMHDRITERGREREKMRKGGGERESGGDLGERGGRGGT